MAVIQDPFHGLIDGILQGHAIATQLRQQSLQEEQFQRAKERDSREAQLQQLEMQGKDLQMREHFNKVTRPIQNGMVEGGGEGLGGGDIQGPAIRTQQTGGDSMPVPQDLSGGYQATDTLDQLRNLPQSQQSVTPFTPFRKPDSARTVKYKDSQGNLLQGELKSDDEQRQADIDDQVKKQNALETARMQTAATAQQALLQMQRKQRGVPVPADLQAEYPPSRYPDGLLPEEIDQRLKDKEGIDLGKQNIRKTTLEADELQRKLDLLKNAKPEDGLKLIDQVVPPDVKGNGPLNFRTKAMYSAAVSRGDLAGAQDVIKKAADEVRQLEVATDPRVQAAKVNVAVNSQTAKDNARTPSQQAVDLMAEDALNGKAPSSRNQVLYAHVMERAAELAKERGLTNQQVIMQRNAAGAYKGALGTMTKNAASIEAFSQLANKNIALLQAEMKKLPDTGAKFLNTPVRSLVGQFGSGVAGFTAALLPVQSELARVLNSANASGVLTNEARAEIQQAIGPNMTVAGLQSALGVFQKEMANRKETNEAAVKDLQEKSVAGGGAAALPNGGGKPADAKTIQQFLDANGNDKEKTRKALTDAGWTIPKGN